MKSSQWLEAPGQEGANCAGFEARHCTDFRYCVCCRRERARLRLIVRKGDKIEGGGGLPFFAFQRVGASRRGGAVVLRCGSREDGGDCAAQCEQQRGEVAEGQHCGWAGGAKSL